MKMEETPMERQSWVLGKIGKPDCENNYSPCNEGMGHATIVNVVTQDIAIVSHLLFQVQAETVHR